ncbi:hypothetical protein AB0L40_07455 [Patulibacter sp. NPDC049589]|uniref:hypothetical protein n=1 Tax=Patulibacter sp. NPDC049589 TaxID=3154731 RepID=UPI003439680E
MQSFLPTSWVRVLGVVGVSLVMLISATAAASASTAHIFNGGLSAQRAYGSNERHTDPSYARSDSDHTVCPSFDVTMNGYVYRTPDYYQYAVCGTGETTTPAAGSMGLVHGAVFNPNTSTTDNVANSYFAY